MSDLYDLIVIGGGIAGTEAAVYASNRGLNTALIERSHIGGTCLNCGCIPSKSYLDSAHRLEGVPMPSDIGKDNKAFFFKETQKQTQTVIEFLRNGMESSLRAAGVEVIFGEATFEKNGNIIKVHANSGVYMAERILLATGSRPSVNVAEGIEDELNDGLVYTNENLFEMNELPSKLVIIGGGVSGVEMADAFATFGTDVTVLELQDKILTGFETDIIGAVKKRLTKKNVSIHTEAEVMEICEGTVLYSTGNAAEQAIECDAVYLSAGRRPDTGWDGLMETDGRGFLKVSQSYETSMKNVYAIGDAAGGVMLAHKARKEAELCVRYMMGADTSGYEMTIPQIIYTSPECVQVGKCDPQDYTLKSQKISMNYSGRYVASLKGADNIGFLKLYFDADHELVGASAVSTCAAEISGLLTMLVTDHVRCDKINRYVYAHPTEYEMVSVCARMYEDKHMKGL